MRIRMLCGNYGYRNKEGVMKVKDSKSASFEVDEQTGKRLVGMGYAIKADPFPAGETEENEDGMNLESLCLMTRKQLEQIAKDMGLSVSGNKEELAARIYDATEEGLEEPSPLNAKEEGSVM